MYGWMEGWINGSMVEWRDGWRMDGWMVYIIQYKNLSYKNNNLA